MNLDLGIDLYPPMTPTRPCAFCLRIQGGCVFADFDVGEDDRVVVVRISFDGYGCCSPNFKGNSGAMSPGDSKVLLQAVEERKVGSSAVAHLLRRYFTEYREAFWPDALAEYELLADGPG